MECQEHPATATRFALLASLRGALAAHSALSPPSGGFEQVKTSLAFAVAK
jgi:hypothetical protein